MLEFSVQPDHIAFETENEQFSCKNDNFVEAVYDSKFYIGRIIKYDDTDYYFDYYMHTGKALK